MDATPAAVSQQTKSLSMTMERTKHSLIAAIVGSGLLVSVDASTVACWAVAASVVLQVVLVLKYAEAATQQQRHLQHELDFSERCVNDHFPESVRQRLQQQEEEEDLLEATTATATATTEPPKPKLQQHGPIFDHHPEATVLFADLKGFTRWSHGRSPQDVFLLLETLYAAFDELALQHNIQKVETIGDCYLCVSGANSEQPDPLHAQHMATFACALLSRATQVLRNELPASLRDTQSLQFRVGMHSGPVVTGVLRGAKRRLQLFGDVVNTASRMESTGKAGRIQISAATAQCLKEQTTAGNEQAQQLLPFTLIRRHDRVEAKGLGRVVTYWLEDAPATNEVKAKTTKATTSTLDLLEQLVQESSSDEEKQHTSTSFSRSSNNSSHHHSHHHHLRSHSSVGPLPSLPPSPQRVRAGAAAAAASKRTKSTSSFVVPPRPNRKLYLSSRSRSFNEVAPQRL